VGAWRHRLAQPALWLPALAVALGSVAGWSVSGRFSMGLGAGLLVLAVALQSVIVSRLPPCERWGALAVYVVAGWAASGWHWHGALPLAVLLFVAALTPRAWFDCAGRLPPRVAAAGVGAGYLLLVVGVALGTLPVWCLVALLVLPLGLRVAVAGAAGGLKVAPAANRSRLSAFLVVFVGQVIVGFLIDGLVR
jgi:hypothetical protein